MAITDDGERYWHYADPVLGLEDVAFGIRVIVPTTVYAERDRDRSGIVGLLFPGGKWLPCPPSTTGQEVKGIDEFGQPFAAVIVWDGALPTSGQTKGELLGECKNTGALWNAINCGRAMGVSAPASRLPGRRLGIRWSEDDEAIGVDEWSDVGVDLLQGPELEGGGVGDAPAGDADFGGV